MGLSMSRAHCRPRDEIPFNHSIEQLAGIARVVEDIRSFEEDRLLKARPEQWHALDESPPEPCRWF